MARASGWAGQKRSTVLGFSAVTEPVLPVAQLSLSYTQRTQRPGNMTTHWVLNVNQNPANLWSQLRSDLGAIFLLRACRAYVPTTCMCTMLHTICDHYLTHVATIEIVTLLTEHEIGLRSDLLASNFTKFLGGTKNPLYTTCCMCTLTTPP